MVYSYLQEVQHQLPLERGMLRGTAASKVKAKGTGKIQMRLLQRYVWNWILSSCLSTEIRGLAGIFQQDATAMCWCLQTCWQSLQASTQKCTLACFGEYLPSRSLLCKQDHVNTLIVPNWQIRKEQNSRRAVWDGWCYSKAFLCCLRSEFWSFSEGDDGEGTSELNPA